MMAKKIPCTSHTINAFHHFNLNASWYIQTMIKKARNDPTAYVSLIEEIISPEINATRAVFISVVLPPRNLIAKYKGNEDITNKMRSNKNLINNISPSIER